MWQERFEDNPTLNCGINIAGYFIQVYSNNLGEVEAKQTNKQTKINYKHEFWLRRNDVQIWNQRMWLSNISTIKNLKKEEMLCEAITAINTVVPIADSSMQKC